VPCFLGISAGSPYHELFVQSWANDFSSKLSSVDAVMNLITTMTRQEFRWFPMTAAMIAVLCVIEYGSPDVQAQPSFEQQQDVIYAEVHGTGLLMDIFKPTGTPNGLAIVDVASGAWYSDRGKIRDHMLAQMFQIFCARGYVVFAPRPGSKTRYTAVDMDQNVKTAIRYVKQNSEKYQIDPQRIGLTGASAGGHLATLAALTPAAGNPEAKSPLERHDTTVRAVGVFFPPTDFLEWKEGHAIDPKVLGPLLFVGGTEGRTDDEIRAAAKEISPLHRVTEKPAVPFLLIHGDADEVVPLSQSQKLVEAINKTGGAAELIVKEGGGHPWMTMSVEVAVLADWFDQQLQQNK
jgi:acetyl esterase/lipase